MKRKKILQFNPEKIEQVKAESNGKKEKYEIRYTVIEEDSSNQEKYLEVGKRISDLYMNISLKITILSSELFEILGMIKIL